MEMSPDMPPQKSKRELAFFIKICDLPMQPFADEIIQIDV